MARARHPENDSLTITSVQEPAIIETEIARRAYELYEERGSAPGHELDDWLTAEREVRNAVAHAA